MATGFPETVVAGSYEPLSKFWKPKAGSARTYSALNW